MTFSPVGYVNEISTSCVDFLGDRRHDYPNAAASVDVFCRRLTHESERVRLRSDTLTLRFHCHHHRHCLSLFFFDGDLLVLHWPSFFSLLFFSCLLSHQYFHRHHYSFYVDAVSSSWLCLDSQRVLFCSYEREGEMMGGQQNHAFFPLLSFLAPSLVVLSMFVVVWCLLSAPFLLDHPLFFDVICLSAESLSVRSLRCPHRILEECDTSARKKKKIRTNHLLHYGVHVATSLRLLNFQLYWNIALCWDGSLHVTSVTPQLWDEWKQLINKYACMYMYLWFCISE